MPDNKKPSWKKRISNWGPEKRKMLLVIMLSIYLSGISLGISIAVIVLKLTR